MPGYQYPSPMKALQSFVSESGARFSVGVGCPSFGGQRTDRGDSSRLRASVVTGLKPLRHAEQAGGLALNSRLEATFKRRGTLWGLCPGKVVAPDRPMGETSLQGWPNLKFQVPEVSTHQRRRSVAENQAPSAVAASRSGHLLAPSGWPNPSVKGTSRKRAAPYVER
jgi:hypothetical protein